MVGTTRHTVGLLYPGYSAEDDYLALARLLGPDVALPLVHTAMPVDAHRVDALLEIGRDEVLAAGVAELVAQDVHVVVWACTSGSFVLGWDGASAQVAALAAAAGRPATSTSFAFVEAIRVLRLRRVAVAATYPAGIAERFVAFLGRSGIEVVGMCNRGIVTAAEVGTLGQAEVLALAVAGDRPDADAVLLPDTALHTARVLEELERRVGKPVLTANQVTAWSGLRLAGDTRPRPGLGALFLPATAGSASRG